VSEAILSTAEHARVSEAIRAAESRTSGEIYVVVARLTDEFRFMPVVWAALAALLLPWPLHLLTRLGSGTILLIQAIFFVLTALALSHAALRRYVVPSPLLAEAARRHARAQFLAHGVHLTERRTGVLIYVALIDRRVEIVADAGIHSKVGDAVWQELAREVTSAARHGRLVDGIINAVNRAGAVLAAHFPPRPDQRNELPDRVVEI
jgi:putative membrane protein